ncbi:putative xyloglucan endotransglucosylase/hydrolase protein 30 [Canna indica]|uniref:Xyloglucan endotransglucosylase/hydrolase n=1 Tax=Canna indica TaxID=4628 RepID=A0AAQ3Q774_9LILI|nr:putative xyloglucan endotransglucosylase/hydrolase protein 30 [Canna indica]
MTPASATTRFSASLLSLLCVAAAVTALLFDEPTISFSEGFTHLFGNDNFIRSADDRSVRLTLNRYSGSGFISSDLYDHGFFSASIKLPKDYTAGVVVAFYTSNGDIFPRVHDELDFEFLGNVREKDWRIQTNVFGNGSTKRGREERYLVPFDPTEEAHRYSILWTPDHIIFYIDDVPIRELVRTEELGSEFPSKPMSVYATIWDGSAWATSYGRIKMDYQYEPYAADFSDLVLRGCRVDPVQQVDAADRCAEAVEDLMSADYARLTPMKRAAMRRFRERYMIYSFCYDQHRYGNVTFPDCDYVSPEHTRFGEWGDNQFPPEEIRRRSLRRSRKTSAVADSSSQ